MTVVVKDVMIQGMKVVEVGRQGCFTVYAEHEPIGEVDLFFCTGEQVICQVTVEADSDFAVKFGIGFKGHH